MPQEFYDYSPGVQKAPVVNQDEAKPPALGEEAQYELQRTPHGAGPPTGSSEGEKDAVLVSRKSKKTVPAILGGALLAFLAACALGGYVLRAEQGGRPPSPIETPMPPTQPAREPAAEKGPTPRGPTPTSTHSRTESRSPTQVPTPPEHPVEDEYETMAETAAEVEEAATEDIVDEQGDEQEEGADGAPENEYSEYSAEDEDEKVEEAVEEADPDNADNEGGDVSAVAGKLEKAVKSLDSSLKKFEEAWTSSTEAVQEAFSKNYMASGLSLAPLDYFQRLAARSKMDAESGDMDDVRREEVLTDVRFIRTLLKAATGRIELLCAIEKLCDSSGIGSTLLGREAVPLPPVDILEKDTETVTFEDFTVMLKGFRFSVNASALEAAGTVPKVLAERLAASVKLETLQLQNDRKVHSCFQKFILELPFDVVDIAHGDAFTFSTTPLVQSLGRAMIDREANTIDPEALGSWVVDWNIEGVLARIELNEEDLNSIYKMRLGSYTVSSLDDVFSAALALI